MQNRRMLALLLSWSLCLIALAAILAVIAAPTGVHASAPETAQEGGCGGAGTLCRDDLSTNVEPLLAASDLPD